MKKKSKEEKSDAIKVELGKIYKDKISGFTGTAIGISHWLTGCSTVGILPKMIDNKYPDAQWFDFNRVEEIKAEESKIDTRDSGGPQLIPKRNLVGC